MAPQDALCPVEFSNVAEWPRNAPKYAIRDPKIISSEGELLSPQIPPSVGRGIPAPHTDGEGVPHTSPPSIGASMLLGLRHSVCPSQIQFVDPSLWLGCLNLPDSTSSVGSTAYFRDMALRAHQPPLASRSRAHPVQDRHNDLPSSERQCTSVSVVILLPCH